MTEQYLEEIHISRMKSKHLKTLLLGPPFDEQILVEETSCLVPDSSISSVHGLHTSSMPHLDDVWSSCLPNAGLSCKFKKKNKPEEMKNLHFGY